MSMVFSTDVSGITLGGSGTSSATIAFGSVQAYGGILKPSIPCRWNLANIALWFLWNTKPVCWLLSRTLSFHESNCLRHPVNPSPGSGRSAGSHSNRANDDLHENDKPLIIETGKRIELTIPWAIIAFSHRSVHARVLADDGSVYIAARKPGVT
jgi:hypothetical protein